MWRRHVGAHPDRHQYGGRKPTEKTVTEFWYKSGNLSLEELKNIKIILFLIQEPVQIAKFPEISHFLTVQASGLCGDSFDWIINYLNNRHQFVSINGTDSRD